MDPDSLVRATVDDVIVGCDTEAVVTASVLHQVLMDLEAFTINAYDFALVSSPYQRTSGRPITAQALRNILSNQQSVDYIDAGSVVVQHLHSQGLDVVEELIIARNGLKQAQMELSELRAEVLALRKEIALSHRLPPDLTKLTLEY